MMHTQCTSKKIKFQAHRNKKVEATFDGSRITSDGGCLLLREVEKKFKFIKKFSSCFTDYRKQNKVEHTLYSLLQQRIFALAAGYEDLNDHDELRHDFLHALLAGKSDITGKKRKHQKNKGIPLAGSSTLNRLELSTEADPKWNRYKKFALDTEKIKDFFIDQYIESYTSTPEEIILDFDATDNPLYGKQEGRFFHGYYDHYCYLPLYVFCGEKFVAGILRTSNRDGSDGTVEILERIVLRCRKHWPETRIILRGDSGFCREKIMSWCEENNVNYVLALAKNQRLKEAVACKMMNAKAKHMSTGEPARFFKDFIYQTRDSWTRERRVIGKAEYLEKGANARFIVTNIEKTDWKGRELYEKFYCQRGDMENRIKEQMLLFSDRSSTHFISSNQLRLWFSAIAYILVQKLKEVGLKGTKLENAQCDTIRNKLFKVGAQIKISVRRIYFSLSESFPYKDILLECMQNLQLE